MIRIGRPGGEVTVGFTVQLSGSPQLSRSIPAVGAARHAGLVQRSGEFVRRRATYPGAGVRGAAADVPINPSPTLRDGVPCPRIAVTSQQRLMDEPAFFSAGLPLGS